MGALEGHRLAGEEAGVNGKKLLGDGVTLVVIEENPVAFVFDRIAAGDDVDQQPAFENAVEGRGHPRSDRRRLQPGAHRDEKAQAPRQRREGRGDDPGVLAGSSGGQQHPEIAEFIGGLRDLSEIAQRNIARADRRAEIAAVAMGRQEPQHIRGFVARSIHHLEGLLVWSGAARRGAGRKP